MLPSVAAVSTVKQNGGGGAALTFTRATDGLSGVVAGQVAVAHIACASSGVGPVISAPAGWDPRGTQPSADGGAAVKLAVFTRRLTGAEAASYTFTQNGGGANESLAGVIIVLDDVDPANDFHAVSTPNGATSGSATFTPNSCTTSVPDCLVLTLVALADVNNPGNVSATNADAETHDQGFDPGFGVGVYGTRVNKVTAGTPAAQVFTLSGGTGVDSRAGIQIAFSPAPDAGEGELELDATASLAMSGVGHGAGELNLEAEAALSIESVITGEGELDLEATAGLAMTGHPVSGAESVNLAATAAIAVEGAQVGPISQAMIPKPVEMEFRAELDLETEPAEDPDTPEMERTPWLQRVIRTAPNASDFLGANGIPDVDAWSAAFDRPQYLDWGRPKIVIGGKDVTFFRGVPTKLVDHEKGEPFGDKTATIYFPQISPFEPLPSWLGDLEGGGFARVDIWQKKPPGGGDPDKLWEGITDAVIDANRGVTVECIGSMYQANDFRRRAILVEDIEPTDVGIILEDLVTPWGRDRRSWYIRSLNRVLTGVKVLSRGGWGTLLDYISHLLGQAQTETTQYTIKVLPGRQPWLGEKDLTTQHYSIHIGEQGVTHDLRLDTATAPTSVFGEGTNADNCHWINAKYPYLRPDDAPVFSGSPIEPGESGDMMLLFEREMTNRGWDFDSNGVYDPSEEEEVRRFQTEAGLTVDGVIGPQTWAAGFEVGSGAGDLDSPFVHSLYSKRVTEQYNRDASGAKTTKNPTFDRYIRRVERYFSFGSRTQRSEGVRQARMIVEGDWPPGWFGTISLTIDPPESSRMEIKEGTNILARGHRGVDRLLHISNVAVNWDVEPIAVTLDVDTRGRDWMTLAEMIKLNKESTDPQRRREVHRFNRDSTRVRDERAVWDCEAKAGFVPFQAIGERTWQVNRIPGGKLGTIVRASFATGIPSQMAIGIFDRPITPAQLLAVATGDPLAHPDYWKQFGDELLQAWGAKAGDGMTPGGWYPWTDQYDAAVINGTTAHITGSLIDDGSWYFESAHPPWLWVAMWVETGGSEGYNNIVGRLFMSNETT